MTTETKKKICIFGTGGFGREVLTILLDQHEGEHSWLGDNCMFMVSDEHYTEGDIMGVKVIPESAFSVDDHAMVIAVGDPNLRAEIVARMPDRTEYLTVIHPSVIMSPWVTLGEGCVIAAGAILTCNIKLGNHSHINLGTTIGHDCSMANYFTTAPQVAISGNCSFGDRVYLGTHVSIREKVTITKDVTIGMSSVVLKNIDEAGTYIGSPLKKLR